MKKQIKIKDFLDRYNNAIIYILLFLIILGRALDFSKTIENGDELWNFANVFKFYNGISLYRDNNVIITPLFFYLGKIFFNILDPNMLTFQASMMLLLFGFLL